MISSRLRHPRRSPSSSSRTRRRRVPIPDHRVPDPTVLTITWQLSEGGSHLFL